MKRVHAEIKKSRNLDYLIRDGKKTTGLMDTGTELRKGTAFQEFKEALAPYVPPAEEFTDYHLDLISYYDLVFPFGLSLHMSFDTLLPVGQLYLCQVLTPSKRNVALLVSRGSPC